MRRPIHSSPRRIDACMPRGQSPIRPWCQVATKMALLPQGAEMLPNPTGSAPGMLLHWQQHLVIAMPGPPGEMRPMFQASVAPLLRARWAGRHRLEITVQTNVADESLLNPLFEQVMAAVSWELSQS